jgi:flagellar biosynthesis anti-sigma factor FlgM
MKINNVNDVPPQPAGQPPREPAVSRMPAGVAAPSTEVTLSELSAKLSQVDSGLKGTEPAFNAQKVAEVRRRIEEGAYKVDLFRIADSMASQVALSTPKKES